MSTTAPLDGPPSGSNALRRNDNASLNHKKRIKRAKKSKHTEKSSSAKPSFKSYKRGFEQCANDSPTQKETNTDPPTTPSTTASEKVERVTEFLLDMFQKIVDNPLSAEDKEQAEFFISRIKQKPLQN